METELTGRQMFVLVDEKGEDEGCLVTVYQKFSTPTGGLTQWIHIPNCNVYRSRFGMCVCREALLLTGGLTYTRGFDGRLIENERNSLIGMRIDDGNGAGKTWHDLAPMNTPRRNHAMCAINGRAFVLGGFTGLDGKTRAIASVEMYDLCTNTWTQLPPMHRARANFAATVIYGRIFVTGGSDASGSMPDAECFDPATQKWIVLPCMPDARSLHASCALDGKLYVLSDSSLRSRQPHFKRVLCYDPKINAWAMGARMNFYREHFSAIAMKDGHIMAVGGPCYGDDDDGRFAEHTAELFTPSENRSRDMTIPVPSALQDFLMFVYPNPDEWR